MTSTSPKQINNIFVLILNPEKSGKLLVNGFSKTILFTKRRLRRYGYGMIGQGDGGQTQGLILLQRLMIILCGLFRQRITIQNTA